MKTKSSLRASRDRYYTPSHDSFVKKDMTHARSYPDPLTHNLSSHARLRRTNRHPMPDLPQPFHRLSHWSAQKKYDRGVGAPHHHRGKDWEAVLQYGGGGMAMASTKLLPSLDHRSWVHRRRRGHHRLQSPMKAKKSDDSYSPALPPVAGLLQGPAAAR